MVRRTCLIGVAVCRLPADGIFEVFESDAEHENISKDTFTQRVQALVRAPSVVGGRLRAEWVHTPNHTQLQSNPEFLERVLHRVFAILDRENQGLANFAELLCSLSLGCAGDVGLKHQRECLLLWACLVCRTNWETQSASM